MSEYYVRLNMNSSFARDRLRACGNMLDDVNGKLPKEMNAELIWRRFTFGVYKV